MSLRVGVCATLTAAVMAAWLVGCAGPASQGGPSVQVPVTSPAAVAGTWAGTVRREPSIEDDWVDLVINPDGTYQVKSFRTVGALLGTGRLVAADGKLTSESPRARATYTLYDVGGKRALKVDGTVANGVPFSGWLSAK